LATPEEGQEGEGHRKKKVVFSIKGPHAGGEKEKRKRFNQIKNGGLGKGTCGQIKETPNLI